jgi:DNA-binding MarR family transcriptional regulator
MENCPPQNNPELIARGMTIYLEDSDRQLSEVWTDRGPSVEFVQETAEVMGCDPALADTALAEFMPNTATVARNETDSTINRHKKRRVPVISEISLAVLTGLCQHDREVEDESAIAVLSETTQLSSSRIYSVITKTLAPKKLIFKDLKSKPQKIILTEAGQVSVSQNLDRVDSLDTDKQNNRFSPRSFLTMDYLHENAGSSGWIRPEAGELLEPEVRGYILHELAAEFHMTEDALARHLSRLREDGYIDAAKDGEKRSSKIMNIRLTEEGKAYYEELRQHPEAAAIIGSPESDDPYPLEMLTDDKLRETLEFVQKEIRLLQNEIGVQQIEPANFSSNMSRDRIIQEITRQHEIVNSLSFLAEKTEADDTEEETLKASSL